MAEDYNFILEELIVFDVWFAGGDDYYGTITPVMFLHERLNVAL